jgi:hypothetical protein
LGSRLFYPFLRNNVPAGLTITSQSWTMPAITSAIGSYTASTAGGKIGTIDPTNTNTVTFYWVTQGNSQQITYTWSFNNGTSISASVAFNVTGPTGVQVAVTEGNQQVLSILTDASGHQTIGPGGVATLKQFGVPVGVATGTVGIKFAASAQSPSGLAGSYSWVQLVNRDVITVRAASGTQTCAGIAGLPELDNSYPYGTPNGSLFENQVQYDIATDAPGIGLNDTNGAARGEAARAFSAVMYLMWTPPPAAYCTNGSSCTIPVPLGYVNWTTSGDAINTLVSQSNYTTWTAQSCGNGGSSSFMQTTVHPTWGTTFKNGSYTCQ